MSLFGKINIIADIFLIIGSLYLWFTEAIIPSFLPVWLCFVILLQDLTPTSFFEEGKQ
jgi:hypothetical protein